MRWIKAFNQKSEFFFLQLEERINIEENVTDFMTIISDLIMCLLPDSKTVKFEEVTKLPLPENETKIYWKHLSHLF